MEVESLRLLWCCLPSLSQVASGLVLARGVLGALWLEVSLETVCQGACVPLCEWRSFDFLPVERRERRQ